MEKKEKKSAPIVKKYFDVKVECMIPATLHYHVLADNAEQASELIKNLPPNYVKHSLIGRKLIKLTVYNSGSLMIQFIKHLLGR